MRIVRMLTSHLTPHCSGPPSVPRIETNPGGDQISVGSQLTLSCWLEQPGNPPALLSWFRGGKLLAREANITLSLNSLTPQQFSCEATNPALTATTSNFITISPLPTTTTTTTTSTTTTTTTTASTTTRSTTYTAAKTSLLLPAARLQDRAVNDAPLAGFDSDYDYSHFDYLNDQFESEYNKTIKYVEEHYDDDYEYEPDEDEEEKKENSKIIKQLKDKFSPSSSSTITLNCWIFLVGTFYISVF